MYVKNTVDWCHVYQDPSSMQVFLCFKMNVTLEIIDLKFDKIVVLVSSMVYKALQFRQAAL